MLGCCVFLKYDTVQRRFEGICCPFLQLNVQTVCYSEIMVTTYPPIILHGIQSSVPQPRSGCLSDVYETSEIWTYFNRNNCTLCSRIYRSTLYCDKIYCYVSWNTLMKCCFSIIFLEFREKYTTGVSWCPWLWNLWERFKH